MSRVAVVTGASSGIGREVGIQAGLEHSHFEHGLGAVFTDVNGDMLSEPFVHLRIDDGRNYLLLTDQPGKDSWPITGATFILMHKTQDKPAQAATTLKFFDWAYKTGDKTAADLDYVPMPEKVKGAISTAWGDIKDVSGKPIPFK